MSFFRRLFSLALLRVVHLHANFTFLCTLCMCLFILFSSSTSSLTPSQLPLSQPAFKYVFRVALQVFTSRQSSISSAVFNNAGAASGQQQKQFI